MSIDRFHGLNFFIVLSDTTKNILLHLYILETWSVVAIKAEIPAPERSLKSSILIPTKHRLDNALCFQCFGVAENLSLLCKHENFTVWFYDFSLVITRPDPFTVLKPQNPSIGEFYYSSERHLADLVTLSLTKGLGRFCIFEMHRCIPLAIKKVTVFFCNATLAPTCPKVVSLAICW